MDHDQPVESDPGVEVGQEGIDGVGLGQVDAGRPGVGGVEAEPESRTGDPARGGGVGDGGQARNVGAEPVAASRRVLEHDRRGVEPVVDLGEDQGQPVRQPPRPGPDAGATMGADVDVDEPCGETRRGTQVRREDGHRPPEQDVLRAGEVDQVRRVDGDRSDVAFGQPRTERLGLGRRALAASPGRRVVAEDLQRGGADLVGPIDGADHPATERQVGTEAASVGKHPRHGTTRGPGGTCAATQPEATVASYGAAPNGSACRSRLCGREQADARCRVRVWVTNGLRRLGLGCGLWCSRRRWLVR